MTRNRFQRWGAAAAALLALGACTANPSPTPSASPSPSPSASGSPSPSPSLSPSPSPERSPVPLGEVTVSLEAWAKGFQRPVYLTSRPGDDRVYVVEQAGRVISVDPGGERRTVLDIRSRVNSNGNERGLLSIAFDPAEPSRMFVDYTGLAGNTTIQEYAFPLGYPEADRRPVQTLLQQDQPYANHNGGLIAFGPDGYLYLGLGDGGSGGDPRHNGQNPKTRLGSILRVDVSERRGYAIPADNPFADGSGGAKEVWAYGLRNPWRFSFDGDWLYIADVGQNRVEEIDLVDATESAGANFGWNTLEGKRCYPGGQGCTGAGRGMVDPVHTYSHDGGRCSITGGYVYRGDEFPALWGTYVYADFCSGDLYGLRAEGGVVTDKHALGVSADYVSSFGVDNDGNLYVISLGGAISRVTAE